MKKIHVCLVGDQTIPNILTIHYEQPDELLFITTAAMEQKGKTGHIIAALASLGAKYAGRYSSLLVPEDSIFEVHLKLDKWIAGKESADFVLNLTGGTKMMSIAAYEYFKDFGARMFYIPLGRNEFITPFPKRHAGAPTPLPLRLNVVNYLAAYGLRVINAKGVVAGARDAEVRRELSTWVVGNYPAVRPLLESFSNKLREHRCDWGGLLFKTGFQTSCGEEEELLRRFGFSGKGSEYSKTLSRSEICYLTGGWLEEFCYNEVAALVGAGIDDAVIGIKIVDNKRHDNEFDVLFTRANTLYTVECKSLDQNYDPKAEALYKIAALQKEFGLRVESFFVSTSPHILRDGALRPAIAARAEQFKTTVVPPGKVAEFGAYLQVIAHDGRPE